MQKEHIKKLVKECVICAKPYCPPCGRRDFIKLDLNEGYYFLNEEIIEEIKSFDSFVLSSYPEYKELTADIASYAGRSIDEVCLTNGSEQAISILCSLFFHKDDEVIVPAPVFLMYGYLLGINAAKSKFIRYEEKDGKFVFPIEKILEDLTENTKGVMLCNPNNPLGVSIPEENLVSVLDKASKFNIPVIIDEVYYEFSGYTAAPLLNRYENLIILRSFSKSFGLAGLRLGYVLAHKNIIDELIKLRLPWGVNHFAVHAGKIALKHIEHFRQKIKEANQTRKELISFLKELGLKCYDTETNFIIVKSLNCPQIMEIFKKENILVSDISHYAHGENLLEGAIRINVPSGDDLIKVKEFFKKHKDLCKIEASRQPGA